jgi:hypothetical protein
VAEYGQYLGRKVTVRYRLGEILLSATGLFSADSGRSIFLEQHADQRGGPKYFRWEIPYPNIYRIEPEVDGETPLKPLGEKSQESSSKAAAASAGESAGGNGSVIPFPHRPKTA